MRTAIFASAFYPSLGGVEELVRQLAREQIRAGDRPLVVTNRWPKTLPPVEAYEGIPVHRFNFRVPERTLRQFGGALLYGGITLSGICRVLAEHQAELLHVQCVSSNAHYARRARRRLGLPLVVTLQGELSMDADQIYQRSTYARNALRATLADADAITACSRQTLAEAEAFFGEPFGDRARVIYNGIRLSDLDGVKAYVHPRPYILGMGRHVPQKGFDVLLRAFADVMRSGGTDHDLLLAGDGTERQGLERLAADLQLGDRVRFLGRVGRPDAVGLFLGSSFFVLPSRHEPMGIVNLEAMAAGKAVIASRVGGVSELIEDGENGLLVLGDDVAMLAEAMRRVIADASLRNRLGLTGRARVGRFDWSVIAEEYATIYEQAQSAYRASRAQHPRSPAVNRR